MTQSRTASFTSAKEKKCRSRSLAQYEAGDDADGGFTKPKGQNGKTIKTIKGINFFDPRENALLRALQNPDGNIAGLRRADVRALCGKLKYSPDKLSCQFRRICDLGIIKRVVGTDRYYLTKIGRAAHRRCLPRHPKQHHSGARMTKSMQKMSRDSL